MIFGCDCCGKDQQWKGSRRVQIGSIAYMVCSPCQRTYSGEVIRQRVTGKTWARAKHYKYHQRCANGA